MPRAYGTVLRFCIHPQSTSYASSSAVVSLLPARGTEERRTSSISGGLAPLEGVAAHKTEVSRTDSRSGEARLSVWPEC